MGFFSKRDKSNQEAWSTSGSKLSDVDLVHDLAALGLDHLSKVQRVGLRDDVLSGFYQNETHEVFSGMKLSPEDVLVDVGCGSGGVLEFCSKHAGEIIALDIDNEAISRVGQKLGFAESKNISFLSASAECLPLVDALASKVLCLEVLEHVDDPCKVVEELYRIGKPGCLYLISVPGQFSEEIALRVAPPEFFQKPHHVRIFQQESIRKLIADSGLTIISESSAGFFSTFFVALYWMQFGTEPGQAFEAINVERSHNDPLLGDWAEAWNYLLDLPTGPQIKALLDKLLPKSQIFIAQKPD
jgi:ubiquinone/menaquinone biosynthesis C-methylase UbiE